LFRYCKKTFPALILQLLLVAAGRCIAAESSPEGLWKTVDDHTGAARALVRIYRQDDSFFGRVEASLVPGEENARCTGCTDDRKDQLVVGMVILRGLKPDDDEFAGGDILDPETG